jgi:hypothetical protein
MDAAILSGCSFSPGVGARFLVTNTIVPATKTITVPTNAAIFVFVCAIGLMIHG